MRVSSYVGEKCEVNNYLFQVVSYNSGKVEVEVIGYEEKFWTTTTSWKNRSFKRIMNKLDKNKPHKKEELSTVTKDVSHDNNKEDNTSKYIEILEKELNDLKEIRNLINISREFGSKLDKTNGTYLKRKQMGLSLKQYVNYVCDIQERNIKNRIDTYKVEVDNYKWEVEITPCKVYETVVGL